MPLTDLTLPLSSDPAELAWNGQARLINCFAEPLGQRAKAAFAHVATDGLAPLATITSAGGIRAMIAVTDAEGLAIAGRVAARFDPTGSYTVVGGIPSDGHVGIAQNVDGEVAIVCDGLYFSYASGVLTQLADPDLAPPVSVCSIGGYFVFMIADGRMFASELNDFAVDGLSYADNEQSPDGGVVCWARGNDLMAGGKASIEVWQVTGAEGFPFGKVTMVLDPATQQTIGVLSADSAIDGVFVASDYTVKMLEGYSAVTISPGALNRAIADDANPTAISVTRWTSRGFTHYAFSGSSWTWVYNATTKAWHELQSHNSSRWRVSKVMSFGGRLIAGHYATGKLFRLDHVTHTEDGEPHVMTVQSLPVAEFPHRLAHNSLNVDIVPGTAGLSDVDRHVMVSWSDNGAPFGTELVRSLGATAQVHGQIRINRLGSSFNRTYRLRMSAAIRRSQIGAKVDLVQMGTT
jgi:hypothetical protein